MLAGASLRARIRGSIGVVTGRGSAPSRLPGPQTSQYAYEACVAHRLYNLPDSCGYSYFLRLILLSLFITPNRPSMAKSSPKEWSSSQSKDEKFHSQTSISRIFHGIRQHIRDTKARKKFLRNTKALTMQKSPLKQQAASVDATRSQPKSPVSISKVWQIAIRGIFSITDIAAGYIGLQLHLRAWLLGAVLSSWR